MRVIACLLVLLAAPVLFSQDGLTVEVSPVVEGKATPGKEFTFKLNFVVPEGFHAYHKDNPGYSLPVKVEWSSLAGLELVKEEWPEPHKKKDEYGEEWELGPVFDIAYTFKVPADAKGKLTVTGSHETQFCDAEGCYMSDGDFTATIEIAADEAKPEDKVALPEAKVSATFTGPAQPGGEATLKWTFEFTKGYHAYHKDNPGFGLAPQIDWTEQSGLTLKEAKWPEPKKHKIADDWIEWEYVDGFTIEYVFTVPKDAKGELSISATWEAQVCDADACFIRAGEVSAKLTIATATPEKKNDATNEHGFYLDFDYALEKARTENKPLLVDFNGKFCGPCRKMERFVFPRVEELLHGFVIVSVQNDIGDARYNELWAKYKPTPTSGVPYYAIMDHDAQIVRGIGATLPKGAGEAPDSKAHVFAAFLKGEPLPEVESVVPKVIEPGVKPAGWPTNLPAPQSAETSEAFDFEAVFTEPVIQPGGEVTLELRFKMKSRDSGPFYMYHPDSPHSKAFDMSLFILNVVEQGGLVPAGDWEFPKHKVLPANDPANQFDHDEWKFYGEFTVVRKFKVPAKQGDYLVAGTLAGQYCDSQGCIWFENLEQDPFGWVASVKVDESGAASAVVPPKTDGGKSNGGTGPVAPGTETTTTEETEEGEDSFFWILLIAFFGGMVTLLTPCVLPVLPLTVSFFVKQAEHKRSPLVTAFIYCTCIVASFTLFGLITSLALGDQGAQIIATNPWVNVAIGVLFLVFALSFFGMFELRAPAFITSWISKKQMKTQQAGNGYATALLSGGSFAIISFSCSGPIAATFLAEAAQGSFWTPTLAMLFFASGMALPIFIMGLFPSLLKKLPKSGGWMNALKVVFAFIEIAVAIRYFSWAEIAFTTTPVPVIFSRELVDAFWIACSVGAGLYLLGVFRMPHDHEDVKQIGVVRLLFALGFLSFAVYLLPGMVRGAPMGLLDGFLPPREVVAHSGGGGGGGSIDVHSLNWHQDLDDALAEAQKTNKPVFVDFTGVICSNCRWVETNIFPKPPVASRLASDYVLVQQWTDTKDQKAKDYYNKYGEGGKGVPMYVILKPDGTMVEKFVPPQFINSLTADEFAEFMDKGKAKFDGQ